MYAENDENKLIQMVCAIFFKRWSRGNDEECK
jgi:hypothetical protein